MPNRTFHELIGMSRQVAAAFNRAERKPWTIEAQAIELTKQVGDLAKRIMVREQYYLADRDTRADYRTTDAEIADELADILHRLICIADHYGIDLETAHIEARRAEMRYVGELPNF